MALSAMMTLPGRPAAVRPRATSRPAARTIVGSRISSFRGGAISMSHAPRHRVRSNLAVVAASGERDVDREVLGQSPEEWGARTTGFAIPITVWSLLTLSSTGHGVEPGPGGLYGAAEGVSYLVLAGYVGWSLFSKATTGKFLAEVVGPCCLLVKYVEPASYAVSALGLAVALSQL